MQWKYDNTLLYKLSNDIKHTGKYACFDLDGTLLKSKSGSKYIRGINDCDLRFHNTDDVLRKLCGNGYNIVIFTNQAGIGLGIVNVDEWEKMIDTVFGALSIDISIYVATKYDMYRKPYPTMWRHYLDDIQKTSADVIKVFYCGDACGRNWIHSNTEISTINGNQQNDFSDSDYKFALNCYIKFRIPEHVFHEECHSDYPKLICKIDFEKYTSVNNNVFNPMKNELLILVGNYASGKTYFANKYLKSNNYAIISPPINIASLTQKIRYMMSTYSSIVIDNNNLTKSDRRVYIDIAKRFGYYCRCINFICPSSICKHNNMYDHYVTNGKHPIINDIFFEQYKLKFECPLLEEGFDEIIKYMFEVSLDSDIIASKYFLFLV